MLKIYKDLLESYLKKFFDDENQTECALREVEPLIHLGDGTPMLSVNFSLGRIDTEDYIIYERHIHKGESLEEFHKVLEEALEDYSKELAKIYEKDMQEATELCHS